MGIWAGERNQTKTKNGPSWTVSGVAAADGALLARPSLRAWREGADGVDVPLGVLGGPVEGLWTVVVRPPPGVIYAPRPNRSVQTGQDTRARVAPC